MLVCVKRAEWDTLAQTCVKQAVCQTSKEEAADTRTRRDAYHTFTVHYAVVNLSSLLHKKEPPFLA